MLADCILDTSESLGVVTGRGVPKLSWQGQKPRDKGPSRRPGTRGRKGGGRDSPLKHQGPMHESSLVPPQRARARHKHAGSPFSLGRVRQGKHPPRPPTSTRRAKEDRPGDAPSDAGHSKHGGVTPRNIAVTLGATRRVRRRKSEVMGVGGAYTPGARRQRTRERPRAQPGGGRRLQPAHFPPK